MEGQLKTTQPKWEGLINTNKKMNTLVEFINNTLNDTNTYFPKNFKSYNLGSYELYAAQQFGLNVDILINHNSDNYNFIYIDEDNSNKTYDTNFTNELYNKSNIMDKKTIIGNLLVEEYKRINPLLNNLNSIQTTIKEIQFNNDSYLDSIEKAKKNTTKIQEDFTNYRENIMSDWNFYKKFLFAFYYVIMLIYFIIILGLLIAIITYLILYVCFKKQQEYKFPMFIIWNALRFFTFSMFLYGSTTGMLSMVMNDSIDYLIYMFSETNLMGEKTYVVPEGDSKYFLNLCLHDKKADLKNFLNLSSLMTDSMLNFHNSLFNLHFIFEKDEDLDFITDKFDPYTDGIEKLETYKNDMTYGANDENPIKKYLDDLNECSEKKNETIVFTDEDNKCSDKNECNNYKYDDLTKGFCSDDGNVCIVLSNLIKNESFVENIDSIGHLYNNETATEIFKKLIKSYNDYYKKIKDTQEIFEKINLNSMVRILKSSISEALTKYDEQRKEFQEIYDKNGNVLSFLNCKYLSYDLNIIYYALSELASKTRSLCGITTSMAFFLAIAVYSTIWAMHHYDRELFDGKKKKRRLSKHGSSHHHTNHSKTKAYNSNEKYINNINENINLSKSKTTKNDNKSKKKKILNETELSLKKNNEEDNTSLKENMLNSLN